MRRPRDDPASPPGAGSGVLHEGAVPAAAGHDDDRLAVDRCPACGDSRADRWIETPVHMRRAGGRVPTSSSPFPFRRCGGCRLVYLAERVPPERLGAFYGPGYPPFRGGDAWGAWAPLIRMGERSLDRRRVEALRRHAGVAREHRVLDVGCGRATFLRALRERVGCRCVGLDRRRVVPGRRGPEVELVLGEVGRAELPGPFDVITMWHYLEHDYDPAGTLKTLLDVARPHTRLFVEVPSLGAPSRRWAGPSWAGYHTPRHTAVYSSATLAGLLEGAGWRVVEPALPGTLDPFLLWWLSWREGRGADWSGSLAGSVPGFLVGRLAFGALRRWVAPEPEVLLVVARPSGESDAPGPRASG